MPKVSLKPLSAWPGTDEEQTNSPSAVTKIIFTNVSHFGAFSRYLGRANILVDPNASEDVHFPTRKVRRRNFSVRRKQPRDYRM